MGSRGGGEGEVNVNVNVTTRNLESMGMVGHWPMVINDHSPDHYTWVGEWSS